MRQKRPANLQQCKESQCFAANRYVRRTVRTDGPEETRGAVKGSFPVSGGYGTYEYLNWAAKFFVDAQLFEQDVRSGSACPS